MSTRGSSDKYLPMFITTIVVLLLILVFLAEREKRTFAAFEDGQFVGGIKEDEEAAAMEPMPVRNDVAQPGEEVVTLRYFKIEKDRFDEFLQASKEGVWPYFEKLGARVVGMWQEVHPEIGGEEVGDDAFTYDTVYLMTRYASVDHWKATREMAKHGGNGPDWEKCREALETRRAMTIETSVIFLKGEKWDNPPWFMPGLDEEYEVVEE